MLRSPGLSGIVEETVVLFVGAVVGEGLEVGGEPRGGVSGGPEPVQQTIT